MDVTRVSRRPYPFVRRRLVGVLLLAMLSALAAIVTAHAWAFAADGSESAARATAQQLLSTTKSQIAGGVAGEPVLVHSFRDEQPSYYIVPVRKDGRTRGLVGVSADGRSWQWYTDGYRAQRFPVVGKARAEQELASRGRQGEVILVLGPDRRMYWAHRSGKGVLVDADNAGVRTEEQVERASVSDTGPGTRTPEALDPANAGESRYSTSATLPGGRQLLVPHYYQVNSYYCGPATVQMLFDYYKPHVQSQYDIANVMNARDWGTWKGAYADDLVRTARFSSLSKAVLDSGLVGFRERGLGYSATMNFWSDGGSADPDYADRYTDLKTLVNSGYPVLMLTWYDTKRTVGHFRVLTGYDDTVDEFLVHDPWYSAPYYGPDIHFKQSFLVDDLWTRYSRWATVITPWKVSVSTPATVTSGTPFTVSATVRYPGVHPMEGRAGVVESTATLAVPSGFVVSEATTRGLPNITASGTSQTVSWTVTPPSSYSGNATFNVTARGKYSGSSTSYASYTDWIGGGGSSTSTVGRPPESTGLTPAATKSAPDEMRTIATTYTDPDGASDLRTVMLLVNGTVSATDTLYAAYNADTNNLYLRRADNSGWLPGVAPGTVAVLDNGYARIDAARTSVTQDGPNMTISWAVSMSASPRSHQVYLYAQDRAGNVAPWNSRGAWSVNRSPVAGEVSQVGALARTGQPVGIDAAYSDPDGANDLSTVQLLLNRDLRGSGAVWLRYDPRTDGLYLRKADASSWLGPIAPGSTQTLDNGLAVLSGSTSAVTADTTGIKVRWGLTFLQAFSGQTYSLYSVAADMATDQNALPWIRKGSYTVSAVPMPQPLAVTRGSSPPNEVVSFPVTYRDPDGVASISRAGIMLNTDVYGASRVQASYNALTNGLYLRGDDGTSWLGPITPAGTASVSNSFAVLHASSTTVTRSGSDLVLRWSLSFKSAYSGKSYKVYGSATDSFALTSGLRRIGDWTVNRAPVATSISPNSSSSLAGAWVTFTSVYGDPDGAANLANVVYTMDSTASGSQGVMLRYDAVNNRLWIRKSDGSGWLGGLAPGVAGTFSTSYGTLDTGRTLVERGATSLSVRWSVRYSAQMKNRALYQYMTARDRPGASSPTRYMGTWTVR